MDGDDYDSKLGVPYGCMAREVTPILCASLAFAMLFRVDKGHITHALMLDTRFKGLYCVGELIGRLSAREFLEEFDNRVLLTSW